MSHQDPSELSTSELERRQTQVLRDVDVEWLRERPILEGVAEAAAAVCDVPMAHVSITEAGDECVVGQIGMSYESYSCGSQTGPDAMVDDQIVIVEDVADADEIDLEAFDRFFGEVRFYAGIPLFVEHTPVGALVVLDTEPGELDHVRRAALFGLVHQVESHLEIHKALEGEDEPAETLSARLTSMVAHATRLRWLEGAGSEVHAIVDDLEDEIEQARELLEAMVGEEADGAQVDLGGDGGFATGAPTQKQPSSLGYVETDVEDAER